MSYGSGWGGSPWGGGETLAQHVDPVFYDITIDETAISLTSDVFIGLHQIPMFFVGAQSPTKVEVVFSVAMSIDSNFTNTASYTITQVEGSIQIPVLSVVASGPLPLRRATLELGIPLESKAYYFLTVSHALISLTGDPSDPDYAQFQWKDQTTPIFRTPLEIPIRDFSGEVQGGILGNPDGLVFFSPALEDVQSTSTIELEQLSVCTKAYDSYEMPNPPDPIPLLTWGPGIASVIGPTAVLWAPHDRLGLPRMDLRHTPKEDPFLPASDFALSAVLVETIDITKGGGFMNDLRWGTYPATGLTVFKTAANKTSIGPGPTTPVKLDWPKIYLSDSFPMTDQVVLNIIDLEMQDDVDATDDFTVQNIEPSFIGIVLGDTVAITTTASRQVQFFRVLPTDAMVLPDSSSAIIVSANIVVVSDTVAVSDVTTTTLYQFLKVTAADTASITDIATIFHGIVYDVSDSNTVSITDALTTSQQFNRTLADTMVIADATAILLFQNPVVNDTVTTSDLATTSAVYAKLSNDTVSVTDATTLSWGYGKSASDTITTTDALNTSFVKSLTLSDTLTTTDDATPFIAGLVDISDNVAIDVTDSTTLKFFGFYTVVASDTVTLTDLASLDYRIVGSDTVSITDALTASTDYRRSSSDTVSLTDAKSLDTTKGVNDTVSVTDSNTIQLLAMKVVVLGDTLSASDSLTLDFYIAGSDNISVTDSFARNVEFSRSLSDTISVTDQTSFTYERTPSDTVSVTDSNTATSISFKDVVLGDTLSITDSVTRDFYVTGTDNISITDTVGAGFVYSKTANDTAAADDYVWSNAPVQYHDTTYSPVGLWQFNGNLNDSSGNGFTMSGSGLEAYGDIYPGVKGVILDGSQTLIYNTPNTALRITGNITIEMLLIYNGVLTSGVPLITYGASGEASPTNYLYWMTINDTSIAGLSWFSESGTGVNAGYDVADQSVPRKNICHFAVTRTSDVIQFYVNGLPVGAASTALTTPTDGSSAVLRVGDVALNAPACTIASLKICASALTSAQILGEYNRTMGRAFGER